MARRVFFSFHYERDGQRASIVRNSWVTKADHQEAGFIDAAHWEEVKGQGDKAIRSWIDDQLSGTSVTVVLIGAETTNRDWVKYELKESYKRGNGMLGIRLGNIKDFQQRTEAQGSNTFGEIGKGADGQPAYFSVNYKTYDWEVDKGYDNLGTWVENAAKAAGR
jgi:hypothetical protein